MQSKLIFPSKFELEFVDFSQAIAPVLPDGQCNRTYGQSIWTLPYFRGKVRPDTLSQSRSHETNNSTLNDQLKPSSNHPGTVRNSSSPTKIAWEVEERKTNVPRGAGTEQKCCRLPQISRWKCFGLGLCLCLLAVGVILGSVLGVTLNRQGQYSA